MRAARRHDRSVAGCVALLTISVVAGCYESHVLDLAPPMHDAALPPPSDAAVPTPDASAPTPDAGRPPACDLPKPLWCVSAGDIWPQYAQDVALDGEGNAYIGGYFQSELTGLGEAPYLASDAVEDAFVAKISPDGQVLWRRRFGGGDTQQVYRVGVLSNGDVLVTGWFSTSIDLDGTVFQNGGFHYDVFLARLSAEDGAVISTGHLGGERMQWGYAILEDAASPVKSIVLVGTFDGEVECFAGGKPSTCASAGGFDMFVARFDEDLVLRGVSTYGSTASDLAEAAALDSNRRLLIAGQYGGALDFGGPSAPLSASSSQYDAFVAALDLPAALDAPPTPVWARGFPSGGCDVPYNTRNALAVAAGAPSSVPADVWVAGSFYGCVQIIGARKDVPSGDVFVARLDGATGTPTDQLFFGGPAWDEPNDLVRDRDGAMLLAGSTRGTLTVGSEPPSEPIGNDDLFLVHLGDGVDVRWARRYGGTSPTGAVTYARVAVPPDGAPAASNTFAVTGWVIGGLVLDPDVACATNGFDVVAARFACPP